MEGEAIFGFLGVLVGAFSNWLIQRGAEARQDRARARVAVRLLSDESLRLQATLEVSLQVGRWWSARGIELPLQRWREHEPTLAHVLLLRDWLAQRNPFGAAVAIQSRAEFLVAQGSENLTPEHRAAVENVLRELGSAREVLDELVLQMQTRKERIVAALRGKRVVQG